MNRKYTLLLAFSAFLGTGVALAGNPDRQGEAGANQLIINPWARCAGLHAMNTANTVGPEAMYLNVAGLSRVSGSQIQLGHTRYIADINLNAIGFAQPVGKGGGVFGISLVAMDLGEFEFTTTENPEGSGATFSPTYFNMGLSYAHLFENKVSVGVTAKLVNESISNAGARAFALDAGVQYVTGENDNFKFGISLRNVGSKMRFSGEGLSKQLPNPGPISYNNTYYERATAYELPSQLNIGAAYDWLLGKQNRLTLMGNFTSNAFSRDQLGGGVELSVLKNFSLRLGYKIELDAPTAEETIDNGISGGLSFAIPVRKGSDTRIALDYGYRQTKVFDGIHNLGLRLEF
ncbi:MAG: PorV/PorQ family protein [Saprospiraceae bacterium]|nr:PorV/PorQ family protein [Saprospiraceae bacterium]